MKYLGNKQKYTRLYTMPGNRPFFIRSPKAIQNAVAIPVLREQNTLFETLASLAENPADDLEKTIVICVVNNHTPIVSGREEILDNQETLGILKSLIEQSDISDCSDGKLRKFLSVISNSSLRLACIDASSPGSEIPDHFGGVGTARKIGMDAALTLLDETIPGKGILSCLDADTIVEKNYLSGIQHCFAAGGFPAATTRYAHRRPSEERLLMAISRYEIFLRSYVIGLSWAGSPYAFPSIGSTISCRAESYVAVRGMNRNEAAEDFHFLDKLAKIGKIGFIGQTTVHPSARLSKRVPFGTGSKMVDVVEKGPDQIFSYHPDIFRILQEFLFEMDRFPSRGVGEVMTTALNIHPALDGYLKNSRFPQKWATICRDNPDPDHLRRQFHVWFNGLRTLRLVHHLSRLDFPPMELFTGLKRLLKMTGKEMFSLKKVSADAPNPGHFLEILEELRVLFPHS
jgi:hypothetical protein